MAWPSTGGRPTRRGSMSSRPAEIQTVPVGCGLVVFLVWLAFWAAVVFVVVHFVMRAW